MMDVYGFANDDMETARKAVEEVLLIRLETAQENNPPTGYYFRGCVPSGPWVQIRCNSGEYQRWQGDPSHPWHPTYRILVFVHGPVRESISERLCSAPGLVFLESKPTMDDCIPPQR
ncbi:MAG TPA: hypothetical protein VMF08_08000 [Candidatus Sulfotelmatobacter sp.]|nr:hypothetical protein [Candidatus Sulfotelmatobacter sp.]